MNYITQLKFNNYPIIKKKDTYSYRKRRGEVIANWGLHLRVVICMKAKNVYRFRVCRCGVVFETRELCKSVCVTH